MTEATPRILSPLGSEQPRPPRVTLSSPSTLPPPAPTQAVSEVDVGLNASSGLPGYMSPTNTLATCASVSPYIQWGSYHSP